jgi:hypothetical protein
LGTADVLGADAVAGLAGLLERVDPGVLAAHEGRDAVAAWPVAGAWELIHRRNAQHRIPVHAGVVLGGRSGRGGRCRDEVEPLPRRALDAPVVHQPVAAHPDAVAGARQVGDEVAALVVCDNDLGVAGWQIGGLGNHPDAGLRAIRARHDAADVGRADLDARWGRCLCLRVNRRQGERCGQNGC